MTRQGAPTHSKPLDLDQVLEQLTQLGGEATIHQLWLRTRVDPLRIDRILLERRRDRMSWVERVLPEGYRSAHSIDVSERRWRLVRPAT